MYFMDSFKQKTAVLLNHGLAVIVCVQHMLGLNVIGLVHTKNDNERPHQQMTTFGLL